MKHAAALILTVALLSCGPGKSTGLADADADTDTDADADADADADTDADAHADAGESLDWANWDCETVGSNYCYANYADRYWIKCYPTTGYECYFGSDQLGEGDSCSYNSEAGCDSCEKAFSDCVKDWISAGN